MVSRRHILALSAGLAATPWLPALADNLITRPIPHSGEQLPVIGLGTFVAFDVGGGFFASRQRKDCAAVVKTLTQGGGKLIDTAPDYGTAETVVGDILAEAGMRDRVFLATKLNDYTDTTPAVQMAAMRASLQKLQTASVDLMQLHSVINAQQDLAILRDWKTEGVCRYVGITTDAGADPDAIEAVLRREKPDFIQVPLSINKRVAEARLIPVAVEIGAAVVINQPFDHNKLFATIKGQKLPEWASEFDATSWGQFFLKYILANPAVTAVIPATSNPEHMADNLGAGKGRLPDAMQRQKMIEFFDALR